MRGPFAKTFSTSFTTSPVESRAESRAAPPATPHARGGGGLVMIPSGRARSNHAEVARSLGTAIIAGRYPAGAKLPGDGELLAALSIKLDFERSVSDTIHNKG